MFQQEKRSRLSSFEHSEPSPVLHIRKIPMHTLEIKLSALFEKFGKISGITMMPQIRQALVEFANMKDAQSCLESTKVTPLLIGSTEIRVSYSSSKHILLFGLDKETTQQQVMEACENNVLLYTIYDANCPVDINVLNRITAPYARIIRIVIFRKSQFQAMVELESVAHARAVKQNLNGAYIYSGSCCLKVDYARPRTLTVTQNNQDTWDFDNPSTHGDIRFHILPEPDSLLGAYIPYHWSNEVVDNSFNLPSPVLLIHNLDMDRINCDRLFNLLCLFGNVLRVKFLRSNDGSAMVEMNDPGAVQRAIDNLSECKFMGRILRLQVSRKSEVIDFAKTFNLPDGSPSYKDFSDNPNNRFRTPAAAKKNRTFKVSPSLHYWNCPLDFNLEQLREICEDLCAPCPKDLVAFNVTSPRTSSGTTYWESVHDALSALAIVNNHEIPNANGPSPFILKFAMANIHGEEGV